MLSAFLAFLGIIQLGSAQFVPEQHVFEEKLEDVLIDPSSSLWTPEQCHLRYYKYGGNTLSSSASAAMKLKTQFAHMATIGWKIGENETDWKCEGVLIAKQFVLTTERCWKLVSRKETIVHIGDDTLEKNVKREFGVKDSHVNKANGIVLLEIEETKPYKTLLPACLWIDEKFEFPEVTEVSDNFLDENEAVSFNGNAFSTIKSRISNEGNICFENEGIRFLQKHLVFGHFKVPFILGLKSDISCSGQKVGTIKTLKSSIGWIETITNTSFNPKDCATRDYDQRPHEKYGVSVDKQYLTVIFLNFRIHSWYERSYSHRSTIGWSDSTLNQTNWHCGGTLISDRHVLTSASCLQSTDEKTSPNIVAFGELENENFETFFIDEIIVHSSFDSLKNENDIALIVLKEKVSFNEYRSPACLYLKPSIDFPRHHQTGISNIEDVKNGAKPQLLTIISNITDDCQDQAEFSTSTQICSGNNDDYLVPGTCYNDLGGPIYREIWNQGRYFPYILGVNSKGTDCGFGKPTIGTKVSEYRDWITNAITASKNIIDVELDTRSELKETQNCVCVEQKVDDVVDDLVDKKKPTRNIVIIEDVSMTCFGYLIKSNFVLTALDCRDGLSNGNASVFLPGYSNASFSVENVILHPDKAILLAKLNSSVADDSCSCVWQDARQTPLSLVSIAHQTRKNDQLREEEMFALYNDFCEAEYNQTKVNDEQFCAELQFGKYKECKTHAGAPLLAHRQMNETHQETYLVGILLESNFCEEGRNYGIFLKLSNLINWIDGVTAY